MLEDSELAEHYKKASSQVVYQPCHSKISNFFVSRQATSSASWQHWLLIQRNVVYHPLPFSAVSPVIQNKIPLWLTHSKVWIQRTNYLVNQKTNKFSTELSSALPEGGLFIESLPREFFCLVRPEYAWWGGFSVPSPYFTPWCETRFCRWQHPKNIWPQRWRRVIQMRTPSTDCSPFVTLSCRSTTQVCK